MVSWASMYSTCVTDRHWDLDLDLDDAELKEIEGDPGADKDTSDHEEHSRSSRVPAGDEDDSAEEEPAAKRHRSSSGKVSLPRASETKVSGACCTTMSGASTDWQFSGGVRFRRRRYHLR